MMRASKSERSIKLLGALHDVADLDRLHELVSCDYVNAHAVPQFSGWLVQLVNAERKRRATGATSAHYQLYLFSEWAALPLVGTTRLTLWIARVALERYDPTIQEFALQLHELLCRSLARAFLDAVGK